MATFKIFDRDCCVREDVKVLLAQMYDYQSQNSVVEKCVTNCQYLYGNLVDYARVDGYKGVDARVVPVFAISTREATATVTLAVHLVIVDSKGRALDPSWEIHARDPEYAFDFKKMREKMSRLLRKQHPEQETRMALERFLGLKKCADEINAGHLVVDAEYYYAQAEFVEAAHERFLGLKKCAD